MKRAVVFRGGGSMGAYSAGQICARIKEYGYSWDEYYGTSVGALNALLASTGDVDLIKKAFTTISDKDVWSRNPIRKNGKIKITNLLLKLIFSKDAIGDSKKLRQTMEQFYTESMYNGSDKLVVACSSNYSKGLISYGRNDKLPYKEFLDAVWASTCVPLLMNPVSLYGSMYQDGGLLMNAPIQRAIDNNTKLKAEDISEIVDDYPDDVRI